MALSVSVVVALHCERTVVTIPSSDRVVVAVLKSEERVVLLAAERVVLLMLVAVAEVPPFLAVVAVDLIFPEAEEGLVYWEQAMPADRGVAMVC